jgi:ankyrin repeat protein
MLDQITDGRTDLVFEYLAQGHAASSQDAKGVSLIRWCAYYGDVSAIRYLLANGESRSSLDHELNAAAFHGHWRLCQFLLETGAKGNESETETGETALHAATSKGSPAHDRVVRVLLAAGANPNAVTIPGAETGAFMRDCRTYGETPLHRAAAFASEATVQFLLDAGANREAKDVNGDSPLSWGSWHNRPDSILRRLCYGNFHIRLERQSMDVYLLGEPHP